MLRKISGFCRAYPYALLLLYPVFHVCFFCLLGIQMCIRDSVVPV